MSEPVQIVLPGSEPERTLAPEHVMALSRASTAVLGLAQLDQYWVAQGAAIARDPSSGRRKSRADSLKTLGTEMNRHVEELAGLGAGLTAAAVALSNDAQTLKEEWPPGSVPPTDRFLREITQLPGPDRETAAAVGRAVLRGITDPGFPAFVEHAVAEVSKLTGLPQSVVEQGAELLSGEGDIEPGAVVDAFVSGIETFGFELPTGFGEAAAIFTHAAHAAHAGGGDNLSLLPALGGLIGAVFGLAAVGAAIGSFLEWVGHRVLAEVESTH
jgi:hypothetical protein